MDGPETIRSPKKEANVADLLSSLTEQQTRLMETYKGFLDSMRLESNLHEAKGRVTGLRQAGSRLISLQKEHLTKMLLMLYPIFRVVMPQSQFEEDECIHILGDRSKLESYDLVELSCILRCYFAKLAIYVYHLATFVNDRGAYEHTVARDPHLSARKEGGSYTETQEPSAPGFPQMIQRNHSHYEMSNVARESQDVNVTPYAGDLHATQKVPLQGVPETEDWCSYVPHNEHMGRHNARHVKVPYYHDPNHLETLAEVDKYADEYFPKEDNFGAEEEADLRFVQNQEQELEPTNYVERNIDEYYGHPEDLETAPFEINPVFNVDETPKEMCYQAYQQSQDYHVTGNAIAADVYGGNTNGLVEAAEYSPMYNKGLEQYVTGMFREAYAVDPGAMAATDSLPLPSDYAYFVDPDAKRSNIGSKGTDKQVFSPVVRSQYSGPLKKGSTPAFSNAFYDYEQFGQYDGIKHSKADAFCCSEKTRRERNDDRLSGFRRDIYHPSFYVKRREARQARAVKHPSEAHNNMASSFLNTAIRPQSNHPVSVNREADMAEDPGKSHFMAHPQGEAPNSQPYIFSFREAEQSARASTNTNVPAKASTVFPGVLNSIRSSRLSAPQEQHASYPISGNEHTLRSVDSNRVSLSSDAYKEPIPGSFVEPVDAPVLPKSTNRQGDTYIKYFSPIEAAPVTQATKHPQIQEEEERLVEAVNKLVTKVPEAKQQSCLTFQLSQQDIFADQTIESTDRELSGSDRGVAEGTKPPGVGYFYDSNYGSDQLNDSVERSPGEEEVHEHISLTQVGSSSVIITTEVKNNHFSGTSEVEGRFRPCSEPSVWAVQQPLRFDTFLRQKAAEGFSARSVEPVVEEEVSARSFLEVSCCPKGGSEEAVLSSSRVKIPLINMSKLGIRGS